jgi:hypothetical protein
MEIAYTAHTETCTLLLDAEGICRSVLAASSRAASNGGARPTRIPCSAERCVGAQYVATLDLREAGGMTALPQPGAQMLFARTEKNGRITLIRSAPVIRFEAAAAKRVESGVHARPEDKPVAPVMARVPAPAPVASPPRVSYGDDDELTIPFDPPTIQAHRASLPPELSSRSSSPPPRNSGVVPAASSARASSIPPPPRAPRVESASDSVTRPRQTSTVSPVRPSVPTIRPTSPSLPRRPSLVRVSAPELDQDTRPYKREKRAAR